MYSTNKFVKYTLSILIVLFLLSCNKVDDNKKYYLSNKDVLKITFLNDPLFHQIASFNEDWESKLIDNMKTYKIEDSNIEIEQHTLIGAVFQYNSVIFKDVDFIHSFSIMDFYYYSKLSSTNLDEYNLDSCKSSIKESYKHIVSSNLSMEKNLNYIFSKTEAFRNFKFENKNSYKLLKNFIVIIEDSIDYDYIIEKQNIGKEFKELKIWYSQHYKNLPETVDNITNLEEKIQKKPDNYLVFRSGKSLISYYFFIDEKNNLKVRIQNINNEYLPALIM